MPEKLADTLIEVRCSAHHGAGSPAEHATVAASLVAGVLQDINTYKHPPRLLLLLATKDWCDCANPLSKDIRDQFYELLDYRPALVGASAPKIFCSTASPRLIEDGVLLVAVFTPEIRLSVRNLADPFDTTGKPKKPAVKELVAQLRRDRNLEVAIGMSAQWALLGFLPGSLPVVPQSDESQVEWGYRDDELCNAITAASPYSLFGVSAACDMTPSYGFQFGNDECLKSGLVLALMEHDLKIGSSLKHGFKPIPNASGFRVEELADAEAGEDGEISGYVVTKISGMKAKVVFDHIPGGFGRPPVALRHGIQHELNVPYSYPVTPSGAVRLKNRVYLGDWLIPMQANKDQMSKACVKGARAARQRINVSDGNTALFLEFGGAGRERYYEDFGTSWGAIVTGVAESFPGIPFVAALSAGEFSEHRGDCWPANALSAWFTCISKERNYRGENRRKLQDIQAAAKDILTCQTPDEVMEKAIAGAISAGAEGVCISRLNPGTRRILGREGKAGSKKGSKQKWELVPASVDYEAPALDAMPDLPNYMAPWAKPALADIVEITLTSVPTKDNILQIIARTKHALFLPTPDTCNQNRKDDVIKHVGVEAQLAIPLIGLEGRVIGTMQIGFRLGVEVDDELFSYWIGFAQKVAASLERAEQRVHLNALTDLSLLGNEFSQKILDPTAKPEGLLAECVQRMQIVLSADYVHMRVRQGRKEEYDLVAPDSEYGRLHRKFRPKLQKNTGSCRADLLDPAKNGVFSNNRSDAPFIRGEAPEGDAEASADLSRFQEESREVQSIGSVCLMRRTDVMGAFVVESRRPFFFTQYRQDQARAAAREAEKILLAYETRRQADRLHLLRQDIIHPLILVCEVGADWMPILDRIREGFCVDWVSLIITTEEQGQLKVREVNESGDNSNGSGPPIDPDEVVRSLRDAVELVPMNAGLTMLAPLLSPKNERRGALVLWNKNENASDLYTFQDRAELDAVAEVTRYIGSAVGFQSNQMRIKEFEKKLEMQNRLAAGSLFATSVMHDLNTPLGTIMRSIDVLRMSPGKTAGERESLYRIIERSKERAEELIQRVAAYPTLGKATYPLSQVVTIAARDLVSRDGEFQQVRVDVENKVDSLVLIDLWPVVSALLNLIGNARHAASIDGGQVRVFTFESKPENLVGIRIHNSGRIYTQNEIDEFSMRGVSNKKDRTHQGLGLNISIQAFRDAGGDCKLLPASGGGVEAICTLPIVARSGKSSSNKE